MTIYIWYRDDDLIGYCRKGDQFVLYYDEREPLSIGYWVIVNDGETFNLKGCRISYDSDVEMIYNLIDKLRAL